MSLSRCHSDSPVFSSRRHEDGVFGLVCVRARLAAHFDLSRCAETSAALHLVVLPSRGGSSEPQLRRLLYGLIYRDPWSSNRFRRRPSTLYIVCSRHVHVENLSGPLAALHHVSFSCLICLLWLDPMPMDAPVMEFSGQFIGFGTYNLASIFGRLDFMWENEAILMIDTLAILM